VAAHATTLSKERVDQLLARYGTYGSRIIAYLDSVGDAPLVHHADYSWGEIEFLVRNEWVQGVSDVVYRRTTLAFTGEVSESLLEELTAVVADAASGTAVPRQTHST
jgi:glycerol-3-phosphate dehydrogenase